MAVAQQFGVSLGRSDAERTPRFFADLVASTDLLREVVTTEFPVGGAQGQGSASVDLVTHFGMEAESIEARIENAVEVLRAAVGVSLNAETGVIRFSVKTSDPRLSKLVAERILELVSEFDITTRRSQARAEREFTADRLEEVQRELQIAEDSLQEFLVNNRLFSNSPPLQFEHDRLDRIVRMKQELVTSLAQAYEQARIAEVRNTPVVTVVEIPRVPTMRDPKGRRVTMMLALGGGVALGVFFAFIVDLSQQARARRTPDVEELASIWRETLHGLPGIRSRRPR
jgi:uncharacterized protein involved in exopolysaccharide biosynthesis